VAAVLQDFSTAIGEILQHKCRLNPDDTNPISHLAILHGRRIAHDQPSLGWKDLR
jgi:hypothetical protein